jgi:hypothetical protein
MAEHEESRKLHERAAFVADGGAGLLTAATAATKSQVAETRHATGNSPRKLHPGIREVLQRSQFFCNSSAEFIDAVVGAMMVQKFNSGDQILSTAGHGLAVLELGEWWLEDSNGKPMRRMSGKAYIDLILFDIRPPLAQRIYGDASAKQARVTAKSSAMARVLSLEQWTEIMNQAKFQSERRRVQALSSALAQSPGVWHAFEFDVVDLFRIIKERITTVTSQQLNSTDVWKMQSADLIISSDVFCFHVKSMDQAQAQFEELLRLLAMEMRRGVFFPGDIISADDDCGALRVLRTGRVGEYVGKHRVNEATGPVVLSSVGVFRDAGENVSGVRLVAETSCEVFTLYQRAFKDSVITGRSEPLQVLNEIPRPPDSSKESAQMLRNARVFEGLSSEFIAALAKQSVKRIVFPGKELARSGELCLLQAGRAIVHGENDSSYKIESGSLVNELQIYGVEIEAFDRAHHTTIAEIPCMVESYYPSVLREVFDEFPEDAQYLTDTAEFMLSLTNVQVALDDSPFFENCGEAFLCDVAALFHAKEVEQLHTLSLDNAAVVFEPDVTDKGSAEYLKLLEGQEVCILEGGLHFLTGGRTLLTAPCKGHVRILDDHAAFEELLQRPCYSREKKLVQELKAHFNVSREYETEGARLLMKIDRLAAHLRELGLDQEDVAGLLEVELIMPGQRLIQEEHSGDVLYVLLEGSVFRKPHGGVEEEHVDESGCFFGGKFLGLPVHETVSSVGVGVVCMLSAKSLPESKNFGERAGKRAVGAALPAPDHGGCATRVPRRYLQVPGSERGEAWAFCLRAGKDPE